MIDMAPSRPHLALTYCATLQRSPTSSPLIKTLSNGRSHSATRPSLRRAGHRLQAHPVLPQRPNPPTRESTALADASPFSPSRTSHSITSFHEAMLDAPVSALRRRGWGSLHSMLLCMYRADQVRWLARGCIERSCSGQHPCTVACQVQPGSSPKRHRQAHHVCAVDNLQSHSVTRPRLTQLPQTATNAAVCPVHDIEFIDTVLVRIWSDCKWSKIVVKFIHTGEASKRHANVLASDDLHAAFGTHQPPRPATFPTAANLSSPFTTVRLTNSRPEARPGL